MDILLVDDSIPFDGYTPSNQPLGGVEKAFACLPLALRRRGHKVRVINRCAFPIEIEEVPWQPWDTAPPDQCDVLIAHQIGRAHARTPVTSLSRMPSSA